jgi:hypothetical protein
VRCGRQIGAARELLHTFHHTLLPRRAFSRIAKSIDNTCFSFPASPALPYNVSWQSLELDNGLPGEQGERYSRNVQNDPARLLRPGGLDLADSNGRRLVVLVINAHVHVAPFSSSCLTIHVANSFIRSRQYLEMGGIFFDESRN